MVDKDGGALGHFIRQQRELSRLSLRELARMSKVSNAYLSQVERGLHEPSLRVLAAVANALSVTVEDLLAGARVPGAPVPSGDGVEAAIMAEPRLTTEQKNALLAVYRNFLREPPPV